MLGNMLGTQQELHGNKKNSMCPPSRERKQTWAPWVHAAPSHWLQKQIWPKLHTITPPPITIF